MRAKRPGANGNRGKTTRIQGELTPTAFRLAAGKPATQESSLDVFCHVIFGVKIDVMDVRGRPQEFVAL